MSPVMMPADGDGAEGGRAADGKSADTAYPVGAVSALLQGWIGKLGTVWLEGELTSWSVRGGHAYAKIKDLHGDATLSLVAWRSVLARLDEEFRQGDRVLVAAKPDFYTKGGTLSMQVSAIRHAGLGALLEQLERLRRQLASEGLFEPGRKLRLPFLPGCIGLVTGRDSDAEKDVRRNAELRWPAVRFRTIHTSVQGARTVEEVSAALRELDADPEVDVIIVARGGGDFQHLLPFSDESLVRLAASLSTPLVSAIGHENDRPILDEVADLRASTPTDAAKRVVPDVLEQLDLVRQARARIANRITNLVATEQRQLEAIRTRPVLARPEVLVDREADDLGRLAMRGEELAIRAVERAEAESQAVARHMRALSPQSTLDRGYAIVERSEPLPDDGLIGGGIRSTLVQEPADAAPGAMLRITLANLRVGAVSTGRYLSEAVGRHVLERRDEYALQDPEPGSRTTAPAESSPRRTVRRRMRSTP